MIRGVYREIYGEETERPPPYSTDWAEQRDAETLRDAARRHLDEIAPAEAKAGDVLLFRMRERGRAKHAAILTEQNRMVHAYSYHDVIETALSEPWRRRIAYAFRFPGVAD